MLPDTFLWDHPASTALCHDFQQGRHSGGGVILLPVPHREADPSNQPVRPTAREGVDRAKLPPNRRGSSDRSSAFPGVSYENTRSLAALSLSKGRRPAPSATREAFAGQDYKSSN